MPRKKGNKTHQYSINVHQTLMKTFLGKTQVLDINNKYKKVTIKIHPPQPTQSGKEKSENADFFKVVIEGKHKPSVRECSRELIIRYEKMCRVIQNIMKTNMEKHVHDENCNHDHEDEDEDEDEPGNLELEIIDN
jgi:hypothetical protein